MPQLRAWTPCARDSTIRDARRKTRAGPRATIPKPCAKLKCPNWRAAPLWTWSRIPRWANSRPRSQGRKWCRSGGCNCSTNPWANPKASASPTSAGIRTATIGARWEDGSELFTAWIALSDITPRCRADALCAGVAPLGAFGHRLRLSTTGPRHLARRHRNSRTRNVARSAHAAAVRRVEPARLLHPARQRPQPFQWPPAAALPFTCGAKNRARSTTCGRA